MASIEKRTSDNGKVTYRVKVRLKGHPVESATFDRLTDAKRWAQSTESAIREGRHFKTSAAKKHILNELIERYIKHVFPKKPKSQYVQERQLRWWQEQMGAYCLADLSPSLINDYREKLLSGKNQKPRSNATVNRYMAVLSHMFTVAVKEWEWMESNPVSKISKLSEPRGRVRFLSDAERTNLLEECSKSSSQYLYIIVVLALSTGARRSELTELKWSDVDLNRGLITLHETKNNERRNLPIRSHALELLLEHNKIRRLDTDLVFPNRSGKSSLDIRSAWELALHKAEIEDFRFHDLRHSAASYLAMNGASLAEIAEVLGHKTLQMVKRYAHLSEAHTASVVEKMNDKIFG